MSIITIDNTASLASTVPKLKPGDTLLLHQGLYTEPMPTIPSGIVGAPVTISAVPGELPILCPADITKSHVFDFINASYIAFSGLMIDARNVLADAVKIEMATMNVAVGTTWTIGGASSRITLDNCTVCNAKGMGVLIAAECNFNIVRNCRIFNNGLTNQNHGIYCESWNNLVENCEVFANFGWGIHCYNGYSPTWKTHQNVIRGNRCYLNGKAGRGAGIGIYSGDDNVAVDNTCYNNACGINLDYGADKTVLLDNKVFGNTNGPASDLLIGPGATNTISL
jgi:parallel beta-helix repeat protein